MKKFLIGMVALAALSGAAMAGEREHDSRLPNPNYVGNSQLFDYGSQGSVDNFAIDPTVTPSNNFSANPYVGSRLDEKNGTRG
jgi:hypothetical protein